MGSTRLTRPAPLTVVTPLCVGGGGGGCLVVMPHLRVRHTCSVTPESGTDLQPEPQERGGCRGGILRSESRCVFHKSLGEGKERKGGEDVGNCLVQEKTHWTSSVLDKMESVFPATRGTLCVALAGAWPCRTGVEPGEGVGWGNLGRSPLPAVQAGLLPSCSTPRLTWSPPRRTHT